MSGRPTAKQVTGWADELAAVGHRIGRRFARSEPQRRAVGYIRGLLGTAERKNGWQLVEHLGDPTPDGVQHLLARADWDADAIRDDLMAYAAEHLGDTVGEALDVVRAHREATPGEIIPARLRAAGAFSPEAPTDVMTAIVIKVGGSIVPVGTAGVTSTASG